MLHKRLSLVPIFIMSSILIFTGNTYAIQINTSSSIYNSKEKPLLDNTLLPPVKEWDQTYYGHDWDESSHSVSQTSDGGYIISGTTDRHWATNSHDILLLKTDRFGNEQWNKSFHHQYGDGGIDVLETNDGGYIVLGMNGVSTGTWDDILLIKTDINGNMEWNRTFGGPYLEYGSEIQKTNDGGYIIIGSTPGPDPYSTDFILVIKTDSYGIMQWNYTYAYKNETSNHGESIKQTADNGYIILGNTVVNESIDLFLIKIDANGTVEWENTYGNPVLHDFGYDVLINSDGTFFIVAELENLFDPYDYFSKATITKTDASGNFLWNKSYYYGKISWPLAGSKTNDDGVIVTGYTRVPDPDKSDIWVFRTDNDGKMLWNRTFGGTGREHAYSIQQTKDEGFIIAGTIDSVHIGGEDIWLIKLKEEAPPKTRLLLGKIMFDEIHYSYHTINSENILVLQLLPFSIKHYSSGEEIIVSHEKIGFINEQFIFGLFKSNI
jgi:hypothetical protein